MAQLIAALTLGNYLVAIIQCKFTNNAIASANWYALGVLCATSLPGFITGGILYSPNMQIIIVIPVWAFLTAGRGYGLLWTGITAAVLSAYFIAELSGIRFHQIIPADIMPIIKFMTWMVAISLVVICLFVYEINFVSLTSRLTRERARFAYEARHDALTGLSNRKLFTMRVEDAINFCLDENGKAAIIYIDLDNFKPINDSYGHHAGDEVLKIVAERLKSAVRSSDSVARLGGDEFGVVLYGIKDEHVAAVICDKLVLALQEPMQVFGEQLNVGASIGVTLLPNEGTKIDTVIRRADQAMYQAKSKSTNICYSDPALDRAFQSAG